ncbi:MAG: NADH-quinone oxidoreductase subunit NuoH [Planctomycetota bacterium]|nr:NADH-quinone oxidoreductase subunit NuoH [Planctomycetota bacterium]MEE3052487.1 NADH-quinone oxidoreductase subunit NuoH [Planctomycetota bacterium]
MNLFAFTTIFAQAGKGLGEFAGDYSSKWDAGTYDGGLVFAGIIKWLVTTWGVPEWVPLSSILNGVLEASVFPEIGALLITIGLVFGFVNIFAIGAVWSERKVSAHMQCRLGPMEVGPHGILQTVADGLKLLAKEDIIPRLADKPLFALAPAIVFAGVLMRFVPLPFGDQLIASDLDLGLFFIAAVGAVEVLGVIMAGWSSNNKWSLFGTIRTATQMVSYEIPIGLAFITVIICSGSFSLMEIVNQQGGSLNASDGYVYGGWIWHWNLFRNPFMLVLSITYFIASLAECKRSPFDLPEAESELVSGFHTEYTGMRFALFFLAEYAAMYLVAAVAVVIFLGGWWSGIYPLDALGLGPEATTLAKTLGLLIKVGVFLSKAFALVFVQMWVRWTLPRIRLDQMMYVCWKVLLPISLVCLIGSCLWELASGGASVFGFGIVVE